MKQYHTTREKPQWVSNQEEKGFVVIHNAPRPLYGNSTAQLNFICGIHYAALCPKDENFDTWVKLNEKLDATQIIYVSDIEAYNLGLQWYKDYLGSDYEDSGIETDEYKQEVVQRGLDVMNGDETISYAII